MNQELSEQTCQASSCRAGEGLPGSAVAETGLWVLIEHSYQWKKKPLRSVGVSARLAERLTALERSGIGLRVQLIRRPGEDSTGGSAVFLARSAGRRPDLLRAEFASLDGLLGVDLESWARGATPAGFESAEGAMYLVCVHGKRDSCCARLGMPVYSELARVEPGRVWQTTHLGGHRFAATLLCLPEGICYGRVEASGVADLVNAHRGGALYDLERFRGRTCQRPEVQAAEACLRGHRAMMSIHGLGEGQMEPLPECPDGSACRVRFAGARDTVRVTREPLARPVVKSCGDAAQEVSVYRCELETPGEPGA